MPNSHGKYKHSSSSQEIPAEEIVSSLNGIQITMPGAVIKKKKKFSVIVDAKFSTKSGNIRVTILPASGWKRPETLQLRYVSIRKASGAALKHRIFFNAKGVAVLHDIGRGDYILVVQ